MIRQTQIGYLDGLHLLWLYIILCAFSIRIFLVIVYTNYQKSSSGPIWINLFFPQKCRYGYFSKLNTWKMQSLSMCILKPCTQHYFPVGKETSISEGIYIFLFDRGMGTCRIIVRARQICMNWQLKKKHSQSY